MNPLLQSFSFALLVLFSCNNVNTGKNETLVNAAQPLGPAKIKAAGLHFNGAISNGMKGDSIFFDISPDGKSLQNLLFKGYWRCSGRLEQTTVGPDGSFVILDGRVNDHITEPPNGGSTAWRFELEADLQDHKASGSFRMNINNLGCDTYKLKWTATAK